VAYVQLIYGTGGTLTLTGFSGAGVQLFTTGAVAFGINGVPVRISMELRPSGPNVAYSVVALVPGASTANGFPGTLTTAAVGNVTRIRINPGGTLAGTAAGHVSVQPVWDSLFDLNGTLLAGGTYTGALNAWAGEPAGQRFQRLCTEEGITFRGKGNLAATAPMGPQAIDNLVNLLQSCADTDRGDMYEPRQVLGLGYRTSGSLSAQAPAVAWDFTADHMDMPASPPTEDDQQVVNDVTATASAGSSSRQYLAAGPLSVQAPPAGIGRYDQSYTVAPASDGQLDDIAAWIMHIGTAAGPRYPSIPADLAKLNMPPALFYAILDADLGDLITGVNPPFWLPPDTLRQLIQGTKETLWIRQLMIDWACVPGVPYDTGVFGGTAAAAADARFDTDGSTLQTGVSSSATALSIVTTNAASPPWTTSAADFPFDVIMAGERMTVTGITGTSSPQAFTVVRSVNGVVKAQAAGAAVSLFTPALFALS
jgi:hypothetical protein